MSCDWNVHCIDCNETHRFDDANHMVGLMRFLVAHAGEIAAMAPFFRAARANVDASNIEQPRVYQGRIDPEWFEKHAGHRLAPISEYGDIDGTCGEWFPCGDCGHKAPCSLDRDHPGGHARKRP